MGLDAVELVMDVEEAFDIKIEDATATQIRTVGDLYDVVLRAMPKPRGNSPLCLSAATFRLLRTTIRTDLQLDVSRMRPDESTEAVLPRTGRRQLWRQLQQTLELKFPPLVRPTCLVITLIAVVLASALLAGLCAHRHVDSTLSIITALVTAASAGFLLAWLSRPFACRFSDSARTFRDLTHNILAYNHARLTARFDTWNATDIWNALKTIVVEQLGVDPDEVTPEARFLEDLGME